MGIKIFHSEYILFISKTLLFKNAALAVMLQILLTFRSAERYGS